MAVQCRDGSDETFQEFACFISIVFGFWHQVDKPCMHSCIHEHWAWNPTILMTKMWNQLQPS